jgi:hypothetical protein
VREIRQERTKNNNGENQWYASSKQKEVYKEKQPSPNKLLLLVTPSVQAGVIGTYLEAHTQAPRRAKHQVRKQHRTGTISDLEESYLQGDRAMRSC